MNCGIIYLKHAKIPLLIKEGAFSDRHRVQEEGTTFFYMTNIFAYISIIYGTNHPDTLL